MHTFTYNLFYIQLIALFSATTNVSQIVMNPSLIFKGQGWVLTNVAYIYCI